MDLLRKNDKNLYIIASRAFIGVAFTLCIFSFLSYGFSVFSNLYISNLYSIPPILASFLFFLFGYSIFRKNPNSLVNIAFAPFLLCISIWLSGYANIYLSDDFERALFWGKYVYIGVLFIPTAFYHFTVEFLDLTKQRRRVLFSYGISAVFL